MNSAEMFKNTDIGFIPKDWQISELEDLGEVITGTTPSTKKPEYYGTQFMFITPGDLGDSKYIGKTVKYLSEEGLKVSRILPKNTVLVVCIGATIGKTGITNAERSTTNQQINSIIPKSDINNHYLYYSLSYRSNVLMSLSGRAAIPIVNKSNFSKFKIPIPPLPEQRDIAFILSTVQEAIEKTQGVIQASQELKKSLMNHLFTYGPVPITEREQVQLKETEIGEIPEEWEISTIDDLCHVKGGKRLPKGSDFASEKTGFPYVRVTDFYNNSVLTNQLKYLTPEIRERIKKYTLSTNDVYISIAGTIGVVGSIPEEIDGANLTENAAKLVVKDHQVLNKMYLICYLSTENGQKQIKERTSKTSQPKLALTRIKTIKIPIPKYASQKELVNVFTAIDLLANKTENVKSVLQKLFKSLLENLMTGKVRTKDLNFTKLNTVEMES